MVEQIIVCFHYSKVANQSGGQVSNCKQSFVELSSKILINVAAIAGKTKKNQVLSTNCHLHDVIDLHP